MENNKSLKIIRNFIITIIFFTFSKDLNAQKLLLLQQIWYMDLFLYNNTTLIIY